MKVLDDQCKCDLNMLHISQGEFSCRTGPDDSVTFRARISGTSSRSASDLVSLLRTWVLGGVASIKLGFSRFHVDSTCDAMLDNIHALDCGEKPTEKPTEPTTKTPTETPTKNPSEKGLTGNRGNGDSGAKAVGILLGAMIVGLLLALLIGIVIVIVMWTKKTKSQS